MISPVRYVRAAVAVALLLTGMLALGQSARASTRPGRAVPVGYSPVAVTMAAPGASAYMVNSISGTVTPLATASGRAGSPISVGLYSYPTVLAVTGSTAVVLDTYAGQVSLINTRTRHVFAPVTVGNFPVAVAISP